jgi:AAA domain
MANEQIVETLKRRYPGLQRINESVFRGFDLYEGSPYAIRYFDIGADPISVAANLSEYQDKLLGTDYFNSERADLRWNHYLYFIAGAAPSSEAFQKAKTLIESDREYARKFVISNRELDDILTDPSFGSLTGALPPDPLSIWTSVLDRHQMGFIVDERLQVPTIVRHIADGEPHALLRAPAAPQIGDAEKAVSDDFLATLSISHFRKYPVKRTFSFGAVNLILGVNGVGKTSLLEAIEYVFCGKTRRGGSLDIRTSVSSVLVRSNLTLQTAATTPPPTLRARHLAWYGKSELRRLTLDDSFSKFNFLDTDAAVRLTVESSRERISEDLMQLLLGAEAAKVLDRFDRVAKQLHDSRKTLENDINIREYRRTQSAERLRQLQDTPRESDQLFVDLLQHLNSVGWKQPRDKDDVNSISGSLQTAIVNIGVLRSHGTTSVDEIDSIDSEVVLLTDVERTVVGLANAEASHRAERARVNERLSDLNRRMEAMDAYCPLLPLGSLRLTRGTKHSKERQASWRRSCPRQRPLSRPCLPTWRYTNCRCPRLCATGSNRLNGPTRELTKQRRCWPRWKGLRVF